MRHDARLQGHFPAHELECLSKHQRFEHFGGVIKLVAVRRRRAAHGATTYAAVFEVLEEDPDREWILKPVYCESGYLDEVNRGPNPRHQQHLQFGENLALTHDDVLPEPRAIAIWYDRNVWMCHYLWREMTEDTERILFDVGYGHVSGLRDRLRDAPMFCPVSSLPYLWRAVEAGN